MPKPNLSFKLFSLIFNGFVCLIVTPSCLRADASDQGTATVRVGTFEIDASPPVGSLMAYDPVKGVQTPLSCRGVVLLSAQQPIVLCAIDWLGISNAGQTVFKEKLARAAGTTPERVSVHALHQHDAPQCDFFVETILENEGLAGGQFDPNFCRTVIENAVVAVKLAVKQAKPVNQLGLGEARVEKVASNRRILGPDGTVKYTRFTATRNADIRAMPVGTIDPFVKLIGFYQDSEPVVMLSYYATHPQSYYRTGLANPDFPGLARNARDTATGVLHVHFNGAGGNIGAGKWNDGSPDNRQVLADRVAAGMQAAWDNIQLQPLSPKQIDWQTEPVLLPVAVHVQEGLLLAKMRNPDATTADRHAAGKALGWLRRSQAGIPIEIGCLTLGNARILHLPGELFVEYQLAAQKLRPDLFVAMAAYGEYAPGYIGTKIAYSQGGYEVSERASRVNKDAEQLIMSAIKKLLSADN